MLLCPLSSVKRSSPMLSLTFHALVMVSVWLANVPSSVAMIPSDANSEEDRPAGSVDAAETTDLPLTLEWDFSTVATRSAQAPQSSTLPYTLHNGAKIEQVGPTGDWYEGLPESNESLRLGEAGAYARVADQRESGPLDFELGESLTIEAWVRVDQVHDGRHVYVVGKGRTYEQGTAENHNYALRLTGKSGKSHPSFLFSTRGDGGETTYHRWTANGGFATDQLWHHVAVCYTFGQPDSMRGWVDGQEAKGKWDLGGPTEAAPVVDNDALWIGSALGGSPSNSLVGAIDRVRLHRQLVDPQTLQSRRRLISRPPKWPTDTEPGVVTITMHEGAGSHQQIPLLPPEESFRFTTPRLALHRLPLKYVSGGIRELWDGPVLVRAFAEVEFPDQSIELVLRGSGLSQVWIDDQVVVRSEAKRLFMNAHQPLEIYEPEMPWLRVPRAGDQETRVQLELEPGVHRVVLESQVGSTNSRCEPGELLVAMRRGDAMYEVLAPAGKTAKVSSSPRTERPVSTTGGNSPDREPLHLVDSEFEAYREELEEDLRQLEATLLKKSTAEHDVYWNQRHEIACQVIERRDWPAPPESPKELAAHNPIDGYINSHLYATAREANDDMHAVSDQLNFLAEDRVFLRRLCLDVVGVPPSLEFVNRYERQPPDTRRAWLVDEFFDESRWADRWADHWTGYWQDVLAENPNILKPTLNNTGPFRFWIHDALRMNKSMDRFVTELIQMAGDIHAGGPAGFGMAAENDVPMAEKAHILGTAFLGVDMKCARCHDAPYHPWKQSDLFEIGAMLNQSHIEVPESSSVPGGFMDEHAGDLLIEVTLQPGSQVQPSWPVQRLGIDEFGFRPTLQVNDETTTSSAVAESEATPSSAEPRLAFARQLDASLEMLLIDSPWSDGAAEGTWDSGGPIGSSFTSRQRLAAIITRGENRRFSKVIANRVWERLFGWGLVSSTDDWLDADRRYPELLEHLANEFIRSGYDLKALTKYIVQSRAYQRSAIDERRLSGERRYTAPWIRRMSAEQLVDSMHAVTGVALETEPLTFDMEGAQRVNAFLNLGRAERAWELISLANERDRPSLSLPKAAAVCDCLEAFGWRPSRQSPVTHRQTEPNLAQPGVVANGHLTGHVTRMTDEANTTEWSIQADSAEALVERFFLAVLTRAPSEAERERFTAILSSGFEERACEPPNRQPLPPTHEGFATWSNHFDVRTNALVREQEKRVARGPQPTERLDADWRERAEDALWALVVAPEFQMIQ
jgi:hypothetical protein